MISSIFLDGEREFFDVIIRKRISPSFSPPQTKVFLEPIRIVRLPDKAASNPIRLITRQIVAIHRGAFHT